MQSPSSLSRLLTPKIAVGALVQAEIQLNIVPSQSVCFYVPGTDVIQLGRRPSYVLQCLLGKAVGGWMGCFMAAHLRLCKDVAWPAEDRPQRGNEPAGIFTTLSCAS